MGEGEEYFWSLLPMKKHLSFQMKIQEQNLRWFSFSRKNILMNLNLEFISMLKTGVLLNGTLNGSNAPKGKRTLFLTFLSPTAPANRLDILRGEA